MKIVKKIVSRTQLQHKKKIKSEFNMQLKMVAHIFEMINSLKLTDKDPEEIEIIKAAFEYATFSLKKHISEKIEMNYCSSNTVANIHMRKR
jgi:hypothetical protein